MVITTLVVKHSHRVSLVHSCVQSPETGEPPEVNDTQNDDAEQVLLIEPTVCGEVTEISNGHDVGTTTRHRKDTSSSHRPGEDFFPRCPPSKAAPSGWRSLCPLSNAGNVAKLFSVRLPWVLASEAGTEKDFTEEVKKTVKQVHKIGTCLLQQRFYDVIQVRDITRSNEILDRTEPRQTKGRCKITKGKSTNKISQHLSDRTPTRRQLQKCAHQDPWSA